MLKLGDEATIEELIELNEEAGLYFFSPDTMRFFNSKICDTVITGSRGWYFITSEQFNERTYRFFTARLMTPDGGVATVGNFQEHFDEMDAINAIEARLLAEQEYE